MSIGLIIGIVFGSIAALGTLFAGARWIVKTVKDSSFDSGKHSVHHEQMQTQVDAAHNKLRTHDGRISKVETDNSELSGKLDTIISTQQTMLSVLMGSK